MHIQETKAYYRRLLIRKRHFNIENVRYDTRLWHTFLSPTTYKWAIKKRILYEKSQNNLLRDVDKNATILKKQ